jgi:uncharacterized membrane protein
MSEETCSGAMERRLRSAKNVAAAVYALQALSFFIGLTYIAAAVVNYVKLADIQGTWIESHFRWQIRTFWFSLLWALVGYVTLLLLIGWLVLAADAVWVIYRIVKGWLYLNNDKPMYG